MHEVQISPQVAELLGDEQVTRLTSAVWEQPVQCWTCVGNVGVGDPVSVLLIVPTDLPDDADLTFAVHAHASCSPSLVQRCTVAEIRARFPELRDVDPEAAVAVDGVAVVWDTGTGFAYPALFLSYRAEVLLSGGPERVDALVSGMIRMDWHLTGTLDVPPPDGPAGWHLRATYGGLDGVAEIELLGADGDVETTLTVAVPKLWYPAVRAGGHVAVFHGSRYLQRWQTDRTGVLAEAARAGALVGGRIPATLSWSTSA